MSYLWFYWQTLWSGADIARTPLWPSSPVRRGASSASLPPQPGPVNTHTSPLQPQTWWTCKATWKHEFSLFQGTWDRCDEYTRNLYEGYESLTEGYICTPTYMYQWSKAMQRPYVEVKLKVQAKIFCLILSRFSFHDNVHVHASLYEVSLRQKHKYLYIVPNSSTHSIERRMTCQHYISQLCSKPDKIYSQSVTVSLYKRSCRRKPTCTCSSPAATKFK